LVTLSAAKPKVNINFVFASNGNGDARLLHPVVAVDPRMAPWGRESNRSTVPSGRDRQVSRREPVQKRSRARVDEILNAASELLAEGGVESLTTSAIAARTGIPIATIYRYFDDRDAIIAAYLDRDLGDLEQIADTSMLTAKNVRFREMSEAVALARMRYYQDRPEVVSVWLGGTLNPVVAEYVEARDRQVITSLRSAVRATGMLDGSAPDFVAELLVRLYHQMFQFVFLVDRTPEEQEEIVLFFVDMVSRSMEQYETPAGVKGIPAEDLIRAIKESATPPS
jgi:AcrR family transcriptional regulator